jgi:cytochrome oxidase Cu insertion factor (SCO1/SenC/PrrC family)
VCKQWRVYCSKAKLGSGPNDYLVDHSILFYLVDDQALVPLRHTLFARVSLPRANRTRISLLRPPPAPLGG